MFGLQKHQLASCDLNKEGVEIGECQNRCHDD